jgi:hypothetical protein
MDPDPGRQTKDSDHKQVSPPSPPAPIENKGMKENNGIWNHRNAEASLKVTLLPRIPSCQA